MPKFIRLEQFGVLTSPLRNIRCSIDGTIGFFDLIPEEVRPMNPDAIPDDVNFPDDPNIRALYVGASRVVEGDKMLRLEFGRLLAVAADSDIDVDLFGGLQSNWVSNRAFKRRRASIR